MKTYTSFKKFERKYLFLEYNLSAFLQGTQNLKQKRHNHNIGSFDPNIQNFKTLTKGNKFKKVSSYLKLIESTIQKDFILINNFWAFFQIYSRPKLFRFFPDRRSFFCYWIFPFVGFITISNFNAAVKKQVPLIKETFHVTNQDSKQINSQLNSQTIDYLNYKKLFLKNYFGQSNKKFLSKIKPYSTYSFFLDDKKNNVIFGENKKERTDQFSQLRDNSQQESVFHLSRDKKPSKLIIDDTTETQPALSLITSYVDEISNLIYSFAPTDSSLEKHLEPIEKNALTMFNTKVQKTLLKSQSSSKLDLNLNNVVETILGTYFNSKGLLNFSWYNLNLNSIKKQVQLIPLKTNFTNYTISNKKKSETVDQFPEKLLLFNCLENLSENLEPITVSGHTLELDSYFPSRGGKEKNNLMNLYTNLTSLSKLIDLEFKENDLLPTFVNALETKTKLSLQLQPIISYKKATMLLNAILEKFNVELGSTLEANKLKNLFLIQLNINSNFLYYLKKLLIATTSNNSKPLTLLTNLKIINNENLFLSSKKLKKIQQKKLGEELINLLSTAKKDIYRLTKNDVNSILLKKILLKSSISKKWTQFTKPTSNLLYKIAQTYKLEKKLLKIEKTRWKNHNYKFSGLANKSYLTNNNVIYDSYGRVLKTKYLNVEPTVNLRFNEKALITSSKKNIKKSFVVSSLNLKLNNELARLIKKAEFENLKSKNVNKNTHFFNLNSIKVWKNKIKDYNRSYSLLNLLSSRCKDLSKELLNLINSNPSFSPYGEVFIDIDKYTPQENLLALTILRNLYENLNSSTLLGKYEPKLFLYKTDPIYLSTAFLNCNSIFSKKPLCIKSVNLSSINQTPVLPLTTTWIIVPKPNSVITSSKNLVPNVSSKKYHQLDSYFSTSEGKTFNTSRRSGLSKNYLHLNTALKIFEKKNKLQNFSNTTSKSSDKVITSYNLNYKPAVHSFKFIKTKIQLFSNNLHINQKLVKNLKLKNIFQDSNTNSIRILKILEPTMNFNSIVKNLDKNIKNTNLFSPIGKYQPKFLSSAVSTSDLSYLTTRSILTDIEKKTQELASKNIIAKTKAFNLNKKKFLYEGLPFSVSLNNLNKSYYLNKINNNSFNKLNYEIYSKFFLFKPIKNNNSLNQPSFVDNNEQQVMSIATDFSLKKNLDKQAKIVYKYIDESQYLRPINKATNKLTTLIPTLNFFTFNIYDFKENFSILEKNKITLNLSHYIKNLSNKLAFYLMKYKVYIAKIYRKKKLHISKVLKTNFYINKSIPTNIYKIKKIKYHIKEREGKIEKTFLFKKKSKQINDNQSIEKIFRNYLSSKYNKKSKKFHKGKPSLIFLNKRPNLSFIKDQSIFSEFKTKNKNINLTVNKKNKPKDYIAENILNKFKVENNLANSLFFEKNLNCLPSVSIHNLSGSVAISEQQKIHSTGTKPTYSIKTPYNLIKKIGFIFFRDNFKSLKESLILSELNNFFLEVNAAPTFSIKKNQQQKENLLKNTKKQHLFKGLEKQKNLQKKRRQKKQARLTGRRKKRKRFFPRPVWLRFVLYKKFIKGRHCSTLNTQQTKLQKKYAKQKALCIDPNLNLSVSSKFQKDGFFKTFGLVKSKSTSVPYLEQQQIDNKDIRINIYRTNKQNGGTIFCDLPNLEKITIRKLLLIESLSSFADIKFYDISKNLLNELKTTMWKSYWLRQNFSNYVKNIETYLNQIKLAVTESNILINLKNLFFEVLGLNFNENSLKLCAIQLNLKNLLEFNFVKNYQQSHYSATSHKEKYLNTAKLSDFVHPPLPVSGLLNRVDHSILSNTLVPAPMNSKKFNNFILPKNNKKMNAKFYGNTHKQSSSLWYINVRRAFSNVTFLPNGYTYLASSNLVQFNRSLYDRLQCIIKNIKINLNVDGQSQLRAFNPGRSQSTSVYTHGPGKAVSEEFLSKLLKDWWIRLENVLNYSFSVVKLPQEIYLNQTKFRILWSLNKTNVWSFKNHTTTSFTWNRSKIREQNKANKTNKIISNFLSTIKSFNKNKVPRRKKLINKIFMEKFQNTNEKIKQLGLLIQNKSNGKQEYTQLFLSFSSIPISHKSPYFPLSKNVNGRNNLNKKVSNVILKESLTHYFKRHPINYLQFWWAENSLTNYNLFQSDFSFKNDFFFFNENKTNNNSFLLVTGKFKFIIIWGCLILFHLCVLFSLLNIGQIRTFLKFQLLCLYKVTNLYLTIIYTNFRNAKKLKNNLALYSNISSSLIQTLNLTKKSFLLRVQNSSNCSGYFPSNDEFYVVDKEALVSTHVNTNQQLENEIRKVEFSSLNNSETTRSLKLIKNNLIIYNKGQYLLLKDFKKYVLKSFTFYTNFLNRRDYRISDIIENNNLRKLSLDVNSSREASLFTSLLRKDAQQPRLIAGDFSLKKILKPISITKKNNASNFSQLIVKEFQRYEAISMFLDTRKLQLFDNNSLIFKKSYDHNTIFISKYTLHFGSYFFNMLSYLNAYFETESFKAFKTRVAWELSEFKFTKLVNLKSKTKGFKAVKPTREGKIIFKTILKATNLFYYNFLKFSFSLAQTLSFIPSKFVHSLSSLTTDYVNDPQLDLDVPTMIEIDELASYSFNRLNMLSYLDAYFETKGFKEFKATSEVKETKLGGLNRYKIVATLLLNKYMKNVVYLSILFFVSIVIKLSNKSLIGLATLLFKLIDFLEGVMLIVYKALEKPAELMIDFISEFFLIEWSSDTLSFIPESFDIYTFAFSQKLVRKSRFFGLTSFFWQRRFLSFIDIFIDRLKKPDTDLIIRQKKGIIFWDIWAEILVQAAEIYSINLSSLFNIKEEQDLFLEKLLKEQKWTWSTEMLSKMSPLMELIKNSKPQGLSYNWNLFLKSEQIWRRWSVNPYYTYQGKDTDLFVESHPPKSFSHFKLMKYYPPIFEPVGNLVCQIYSGTFVKTVSKNLLLIGSRGTNKTLLVQAIAGETELKIMIDNANRYALTSRGVALGMKLLKDVFDALALQAPCLFLIEDIHIIGERRPMLISDDENIKATENSFGVDQEEIHEKNQVIYQLSRHSLVHYKKPYKGDFSLLIPTNHFSLDFFLGFSPPKTRLISQVPQNPLPIKSIEQEISHQNNSDKTLHTRTGTKLKLLSQLQLPKKESFSPPSTSPFTILLLKEQKKLKTKKIVAEMPWGGLSSDQLIQLPKTSYSVRVKVALLADIAIRNLSVKLDRITDLLIIIDSVRSHRGFIVVATTHIPSILDPALRRPGRFDETLTIPALPNLWSRWEILKASTSDFISTLDLMDYAQLFHNLNDTELSTIISKTKLFLLTKQSFLKEDGNFKLAKLLTKPNFVEKSQKKINLVAYNLYWEKHLDKQGKLSCTSFEKLQPSKPILYKNKTMNSFGEILKLATYPNLNDPFSIRKYEPIQIKFETKNNQQSYQFVKNENLKTLNNEFNKANYFPSFLGDSQQQALLLAADFSSTKNLDKQAELVSTYVDKDQHLEPLKTENINKNFKKISSLQNLLRSFNPSVSMFKASKNYLSISYFQICKWFISSQLIKDQKSYTTLLCSSISNNSISNSNSMLSKEILTSNLSQSENTSAFSIYNSKSQLKNELLQLFAGKIGEFFAFYDIKSMSQLLQNTNPSAIYPSPSLNSLLLDKQAKLISTYVDQTQHLENVEQKISVSSELLLNPSTIDNYQTFWSDFQSINTWQYSTLVNAYGIDETWRRASDLIFSIIYKRCLYNKNILIYRLFNLQNMNSLRQPPSPPVSTSFIAAKRYENYKRIEFDFQNRITFSVHEKIQKHQQQRYIKTLYNKPIQKYFRSELQADHKNSKILNSLATTSFENSFREISLIDTNHKFQSHNKSSRLTSSSFFFNNRINIRHRFYLINQWWNTQLPEQNAETTFLSEIDWRYIFISGIGDLWMDFPDTDQHYNPRTRQWMLNSGYWNYWYNFEKLMTQEIYYQFLLESFYKAYNLLDRSRELIDLTSYQFLTSSILKEIDFITYLKRFYLK